MLAEFAAENLPPSAWATPVDGVTVYHFNGRLKNDAIAVQLAPGHYEAFFCLKGALTLTQTDNHTRRVAAHGILLVSDVNQIASAQASQNLCGLLVAVNAADAGASLAKLVTLTGIGPLNTKSVGARMRACGGCAVIEGSAWADAAFVNFSALSPEEQRRYALFKAMELLYLLSTHDLVASHTAKESNSGTLTRLVQEIAYYMRQHLDERLTIAGLSSQFGVSPTALKKEFHRLYGKPLHTWLQEQRLEQAAQLLRESSMTVLEIAQEVGYSSTSQFSAAFARHFGHTPGQYRRISV